MRAAFILPLLFVVVVHQINAADPLYHRQVHQKSPGCKDLVMTVRELRRDEKTSTLKVKRTSGSALGYSMIICQALYDIAQARQACYFIGLDFSTASDGSEVIVVGFTRSRHIDPQKYFGLKQPLEKDDQHQFGRVKDFDFMIKNREWTLDDLDAPFRKK